MSTLSQALRRLAAAALLVIAGSAAAAPEPASPPAPVAPPPAITAIARPALWKIADRDTTIYLFGTVHALPPGIDWLNGPVAKAFAESRELMTEIVAPEPAQMQAVVLSRAVLPAGKSLRSLLPPSDRKEYEAALTDLRLPAETFDRFEPWYAAVGLSTLPLLRDGFASANGVDEALAARAREAGKPHTAFETPDGQIALFDGLPMANQVRYLDQVVEQLPTIRTQLGAMIEAWRSGDAEGLARLMNETNDDPLLVERLLVGRNRAWAERIAARMAKPGIVFVAVGAGHLAGQGSVLDMLAARGIAATRVQ